MPTKRQHLFKPLINQKLFAEGRMSSYSNDVEVIDDSTLVQTSYYINHVNCADSECRVILFWESRGGEDDGACFRVDTCTCDTPSMCCINHKLTYTCPECEETTSNDAEINSGESPVVSRKRTREELESAIEKLPVSK